MKAASSSPFARRSVPAEKFIAIMRAEAAFCGIRVLAYVIMANHFHLVCEVPDPRPLSQSEVLERIEALYGRRRVRGLKKQLAQLSEQPGGVELCHKLLEPFRKIRYFTDGVILGSREFVQSHCQQLEQRIGYKRKSGPTALKIFGPATLWVFRNLRVRRFG